jgi:hypothetical protein
MTDEPIKKCASCGAGDGFTDQPADYADNRWPGNDQPKSNRWTRCNACGASFIIDYVHLSMRKAVAD